VGFNDSALPELRASTSASAIDRVNANLFGFQSLQYNGTNSIDFALKGLVHYITSSHVNATPNFEMPGEGQISGYLGVWNLSAITGITTASDILNNIFYAPCGSAGVIAAGGFSGAGTSGENHLQVGLDTSCSGGAITLNPGDKVLVVAGMQTPTNRGGWVDAMNTFDVLIDYDKTVFTGTTEQVGAQFLSDSLTVAAPVPEPGTWAMMLIGFSAIGASMRRRRRVSAMVQMA
jgi:hypothetical protein